MPELVWRGHDDRLQRDDCLCSALHGGVAGDLDLSDHLARSVCALRDACGGSGEHRAGGVLGVDRIALAALAAVTAVWSSRLHDTLIVAPEIADESLAVGA